MINITNADVFHCSTLTIQFQLLLANPTNIMSNCVYALLVKKKVDVKIPVTFV